MFKGLELMFKGLELLYTALGQVFQALEHKTPLRENNFSPRGKYFFPWIEKKVVTLKFFKKRRFFAHMLAYS